MVLQLLNRDISLYLDLCELFRQNEDWLVERTIEYAKHCEYTKYTSTLREAWRVSISGLTDGIIRGISGKPALAELHPDEEAAGSPIGEFAFAEAIRHRERGVSLSMFLGLMKYYRQSYLDLIAEKVADMDRQGYCQLIVNRCFDRMEIAFCAGWASVGEDKLMRELQATNRKTVNKKNELLTLLESSPNGIILVGRDRSVTYINHVAITALFGPAGPGIGEYGAHGPWVIPDWVLRLLEQFSVTTDAVATFDAVPDPAGDIFYRVAMKRMLDVSGKFEGIVIVMTDVTELMAATRKLSESEAAMVRLDRLNLVGEMAAGIGHEIRNPITAVRGYLQMFQNKERYAEHREQFGTMIEELDRANLIISEYLSLAKNKKVELKEDSLNRVLNALYPLLRAEAFQTGHKLELDLGDIPVILFDEKEIRQLVLNLVRNGLEAMAAGGVITISTGLEYGKAVLAVRDSGPGIPHEVMRRLGTPFVTTKENGSGLGLAVCYRIADRHGARMEVNTSPQGTTIRIIF